MAENHNFEDVRSHIEAHGEVGYATYENESIINMINVCAIVRGFIGPKLSEKYFALVD